MFISAIERVSKFTRPVNSIIRIYGGKQLIQGSSTLFFVNDKGYAITCKHVMDMLTNADNINKKFIDFKKERQAIANDGKFKANLKGLELKYKYSADTVVQVKNNFVDCVDSMSGFTCTPHPTFDLAIIKFNDYKTLHYQGYASFLKDTSKIKQGKFLCRLGFPFPEFSNFTFNTATDDIEWTNTGMRNSPQFPIEGMVTRFLAEKTQVYGIELSTPGLRGQSGGPLFDDKGTIYGMQSSTKHLHLGFDLIDKEIMVNNGIKKISDYSFLHLGQCIHVETIKNFLREHNVEFQEED